MECQSCNHFLIEKSRFCDDCGVATASIDFDSEALQSYCSKCAALLRGSRKYCIHCGEPSPHSGKFRKKKEQSWISEVLLDSRVQMGLVSILILVAALPAVSPLRYRLISSVPFVEAYIEGDEDKDAPTSLLRSAENFAIRPLVDPLEEPADGQKVRKPAGVARDARGNIYISDAESHVVYKVDGQGKRSVFAGSGSPGYSGDGAAAWRAELNEPLGLAIDDRGGLLIADSGNDVIRRVNPEGFISTIAGAASTDAAKPDLTVGRLPSARSAQLMAPSSVSADIDGTLYVTESPCEIGPRDPTVWVLSPKS
ncbi:MAG: hypothetical protein GC160_01110 [Acidobacteria bacterium]|nr:hypothetical protein [Acidobacteriota bacterium]